MTSKEQIEEQRSRIRNRIREIRSQRDREIENAIMENISFDKNKMYFYNCNGSGYYLKYSHVELERVVFNIYSKGGIKKDKKFRINWYSISSIVAKD